MANPFLNSALNGLTIEGNLLAPSILKQISDRKASDQGDNDYDLPRGVTLRDELSRYFRIGQADLRHLHASSSPSLEATIHFTSDLLTQALGFPLAVQGNIEEVNGRLFPVSLQALDGRMSVLVVPPAETLDVASVHLRPDNRRRSAATALQDWLNVSDPALWGLCTNGIQLRVLRDNPSLTRPAYIEFDLREIFDNQDFASFTMLWLLLHRTRFGRAGTPVSDCPLERWRDAGAKTGEVALLHLSGNVRESLLALANGFLEHPDSADLRQRLASGALTLSSASGNGQSFFSQLLRLVYRLIFLLAAEDRELLQLPDTPSPICELYAAGYSAGSLRDRAVLRAAHSGVENTFSDRWRGLLLTFQALAHGEPRLGLPALGGLFSVDQTPDLDNLSISNRALFAAMYSLAWLRDGPAPVRVNWRDMQTEELGSVYEGLLELTPRLSESGREITFVEGLEAKGNERKTSGSYYTPDSLVQTLLDSALDPVLERLETEASTTSGPDPAAHILTITVLDPACGSGHFLLAAARRIASRVALLRTGGVFSRADYHRAMRDVVRLCIYGVDRNSMAVELTRVALWIETVEPGKPLGFLDANLRCGDSLLGVFSLEALRNGIPEAAYKPLAGDDKAVAKAFAVRNKEDLKGQARLNFSGRPPSLPVPPTLAASALTFRSLPEDSALDVEQRVQAFARIRSNPVLTQWFEAADLYIAAFLAPKVKPPANTLANPEFPGHPLVPVSGHVWSRLHGSKVYGPLLSAAQTFTTFARAFHWPLEFPHILLAQDERRRGFDVVLGNPPWERIKLQEQEFFAAREPAIAEAPNAAARGRLIAALKTAPEGSRERCLHEEFEIAKRTAEAASIFARLSAPDLGRFPLTGRGDVNTYALFAELFSELVNQHGRAGVIVPTGIATDATTAPFFASLVEHRRLARLIDFENRNAIFPNVHRSYKFSLLTVAYGVDLAWFTFFLTDPTQIKEPNRTFSLSPTQIAAINPNTKTAPVFRSTADADLTRRIYERVPVLLDDTRPNGNPWGVSFARLFDMSNDSGLFRTQADLEASSANRSGNKWLVHESLVEGDESSEWYLPLYEAKLVHQFDHRWATFDGLNSRDVTPEEQVDSNFEVTPRYWVQETEVADRLTNKHWHHEWLMGWRDICRNTDVRTLISAAVPIAGYGDKFLLINTESTSRLKVAFLGTLNSLVLDFCARQKLGGTSLKYFTFKQLPILPPTRYMESDLSFIVPRIVELTYTSYSMTAFARDLGYESGPFPWDEDRRALLRAELDAWYACAYGLSRDDLRYILDPADLLGPDYPSETFRVLKKNEISQFGEYHTQRLVLAAWDRQAAGLTPESELNRLPIVLTSQPDIPEFVLEGT
jgi:N-6 DNA Methylase